MKQLFLATAALMAAATAGAQVVDIESVVPMAPGADVYVTQARISPDGKFAIASHRDNNALWQIDFATGSVRSVAENGSMLDLAFSPDSRAIVFRNSKFGADHLRRTSIESVDLTEGISRTVAAPARHAAAYSVSREGVLTVAAEGRSSARAIRGGAVAAPSYTVSIHYGHLELTKPDGTVVTLDPQGKGSYLTPSISPDGTKVAYYKVHQGCFVCDLDGSNVTALGYIHAPAWLNDNVVIGMQDEDNGMVITQSAIVAADLAGNIQTLTSSDVIAMQPTATADGKHILFNAADGKLFMINLK